MQFAKIKRRRKKGPLNLAKKRYVVVYYDVYKIIFYTRRKIIYVHKYEEKPLSV